MTVHWATPALPPPTNRVASATGTPAAETPAAETPAVETPTAETPTAGHDACRPRHASDQHHRLLRRRCYAVGATPSVLPVGSLPRATEMCGSLGGGGPGKCAPAHTKPHAMCAASHARPNDVSPHTLERQTPSDHRKMQPNRRKPNCKHAGFAPAHTEPHVVCIYSHETAKLVSGRTFPAAPFPATSLRRLSAKPLTPPLHASAPHSRSALPLRTPGLRSHSALSRRAPLPMAAEICR